jgi:hypothetical protein
MTKSVLILASWLLLSWSNCMSPANAAIDAKAWQLNSR